jgi:chemotaxis methyl-accepting protein methylase
MKKQPKALRGVPESASVVPSNISRQDKIDLFPIVGIGASAGGLEALDQFLKHVPKGSGIAFVILQHLDPTHKGILVELLQRATIMPVVQAKDRMKVEPDRVYVIPPNKDMSILHGVLHLLAPVAPRGLRLPIDFFFRALADDRQERSIGVILSGMGSDGTLGLRAIKEKAGMVFVQSLTSAKFNSMPKSAIDAGLADVIAPVEELPGRIIACLKHAPHASKPELPMEGKTRSDLEKIIILLRAQTGHDFSMYKKSTINRRIERRMSIHQLARLADYVRYLRETPQETELLFKELLIGVTSFFRDPAAWEQLKSVIIPALLAARPAGGALRAWTTGCSTGEEAYSLSIVFKEVLDQVKPAKRFSLQIFATDLDRDAIEKARSGIYPANIAADVSSDRLDQFFVHEEQNYRICKEIRETVVFATQNVIMDPPFTKLDLLICRNLLIYLDHDLQKKLLPLFHYSLNPGGVLFLGSAEAVSTVPDLFDLIDKKARLYRRLESAQSPVPVEFPPSFVPDLPDAQIVSTPPAEAEIPVPNINAEADHLVLKDYCPAAVLTNDRGDIVYIGGHTGKYLEPAAGKANWNIFVMAREGLRYDLDSSFRQALRKKSEVTLKGVNVRTDGGVQTVNVTVRPLAEPPALQGKVMIVFTDVATPPEVKSTGRIAPVRTARIAELEQDLHQARQELQITREEMQSSREELKSANEEMQSTNEELQSTNEELTTSKEEMQSMNEELQTVNSELQAKVDELTRVSNDMKNLLDSTGIATLFLDNQLNVRRFTPKTTDLIKLIPGDAGRPLSDIVTDLDYPELATDVREVLRTLVFTEKTVKTGDGRWFHVRIMPYRTYANMIDGAVITFVDVTVSKTLEAELRQARADLENQVTKQSVEMDKSQGPLRAKKKSDQTITDGKRDKGSDKTPEGTL